MLTDGLADTDPQPDFIAPQGGALIPWAQTITDQYGAAVDIAGATVRLRFGPENQTTPSSLLNGSVVGTSPLTQAQYVFQSADLATAGNYSAQFAITMLSGEVIYWPVGRLAVVQVTAQLP